MTAQGTDSKSATGTSDIEHRTATTPERGLQMRSTLDADGTISLALSEVAVRQPGPRQVVVRVKAAPINPSDLMTMMGPGDIAGAQFDGTPESPSVRIPVPPASFDALRARVGISLPVGQEGSGHVVAAGDDATHLLGRSVALMAPTAGTFAEYVTVPADDCLELSDTTDLLQAAAMFVNPLTALAIVETVRLEGHEALIHTAAASSVGQMLVKICRRDDIALVNVVRRDEQVQLLRAIGAEHVCNSSHPTFRDDLIAAINATGARVAFDAVGGGTMAGDLLAAMESAAASRMKRPSPYGSLELKHVYLYGHLDTTPTLVHNSGNGLLWGLSSWMMPQILARVGPQRRSQMHQRILDELTTTFKTDYSQTISLTQALTRDAMTGYCRQATGSKYLITA